MGMVEALPRESYLASLSNEELCDVHCGERIQVRPGSSRQPKSTARDAAQPYGTGLLLQTQHHG